MKKMSYIKNIIIFLTIFAIVFVLLNSLSKKQLSYYTYDFYISIEESIYKDFINSILKNQNIFLEEFNDQLLKENIKISVTAFNNNSSLKFNLISDKKLNEDFLNSLKSRYINYYSFIFNKYKKEIVEIKDKDRCTIVKNLIKICNTDLLNLNDDFINQLTHIKINEEFFEIKNSIRLIKHFLMSILLSAAIFGIFSVFNKINLHKF